MSSHCCSESWSNLARYESPTLLTRTSTGPTSASASADQLARARPARSRSAATCSASPIPGGSVRREHVTTRAPSSTSMRAARQPDARSRARSRRRRGRAVRDPRVVTLASSGGAHPRAARRDRLEPGPPVPRPRRPAAERSRTGAGAPAGRRARGRWSWTRSTRATSGGRPRPPRSSAPAATSHCGANRDCARSTSAPGRV